MSTLHPNAPQCHHVRTNGIRCGSPALRKQTLCHYHHKAKNQRDWVRAELPCLEDGNAIQLGIARIMRLVMIGGIEYRAAHLMIDAMRLSIRNLKNMHSPYAKDVITVDPHYDAANAGLISVPVTFAEQEELAARGAFADEATSPQDDTYLAQHVSAGSAVEIDSSPVGTTQSSSLDEARTASQGTVSTVPCDKAGRRNTREKIAGPNNFVSRISLSSFVGFLKLGPLRT